MSYRFSVVLPVQDNDGVSLANEVASVKSAILMAVGGYSVVSQSGVWLGDDGKVYEDKSELVTAITDSVFNIEYLLSLAPRWSAFLRQECVLTTVDEVKATFHYPVKG